MTVFDNIAFGLTVLPRRDRLNCGTAIKTKVTQLLEWCNWRAPRGSLPANFPADQKQRVALQRARSKDRKFCWMNLWRCGCRYA